MTFYSARMMDYLLSYKVLLTTVAATRNPSLMSSGPYIIARKHVTA